MGLSLKDISSGVLNVGNVVLDGVRKFNEIRNEAVGVVPSTTTAPVNNVKAATEGTVQQKQATSGTLDQQVATAQGGGLGIVVVLLVVLVLWKAG